MYNLDNPEELRQYALSVGFTENWCDQMSESPRIMKEMAIKRGFANLVEKEVDEPFDFID